MQRRRFFWHLYALYIGLTILLFIAASEYASRSLREFYSAESEKDLTSRAMLALELIRDRVAADPAHLDAFCKALGRQASVRVTVIRPDGVVIADSVADTATMENHATRPEVREAFAGRTGSSIRFSDTVHENFMYVAVPLKMDGKIISVVRTAVPSSAVSQALGEFQRWLALTVTAAIALVFLVISALVRRLNRPLDEMRAGAKRFAEGDFNFRLRSPNYEEFGALADALNSMAEQLKSRMDSTGRQRDEMQAVLGSMREAVIAVDADEHILQMNSAAAGMLAISEKSGTGQILTGVIRNTGLLRLLRIALEKRQSSEGEVVMHRDGEERTLQVHATPLRDASGKVLGAMIVANDITQLRKLERVRRDFVANVSHELKTPLTSIKGFVETLQEGALEQPDEARRFLAIIARQVARLQAVLADLLSLSRIEQQAELDELRFQEGAIRPVLDTAIELCAHRATQKKITITVACPADARARMNAALLEQAAVNLIENAVKYSDPGSTIRIETDREPDGWQIAFRDQGCGIETEHLDRVFERFYRVDKARTRSEGGTGLGLSIVKHIMTAHVGSVTVQSTPGKGSSFTLHLPDA